MVEAVGTAQQRETRYTYDGMSRLTQIAQDVNGINAVTTMTYDAMGNLLTVTDPENSTTTYTYDRLSRRTSVTQPNGEMVRYGYTGRDQVAWVINARGHKITYGYHGWGGLAQVHYYATETDTTPTRTVSYGYEANGNLASVSDSAIQAGALYGFTYDAEDRLDVTTIGYLPTAVTLNNDYDRYGNRNQLMLNDGTAHTHSYTYNKLNQLSAINLPGSQNFIPEYYESLGRLKSLTYPNGIKTTYTYEDHGPIKQILTESGGTTPTTIEQLDYVYDALLNVDTMTSQRDGGTHDYGYDTLDHLTSAVHPAATGLGSESFSYDKVGNRTNAGYDYNGNHQITESPDVASYSFDTDGSMVQRDYGSGNVDTFAYNEDNRLVSFTDGDDASNNATYRYDPFGRRISKTVNGITTWFLWDGSQLIGEYSGSGSRSQRYAYLPYEFTPIQVEDSNGVYGVHSDHLQTPKFLTDSSQVVVWSQVQEAFGRAIVEENVDGDANSIVLKVRFPGQYFDEESGLYYNYFRDYDPSLGRYIQSDPIGLEGGLNTFTYVGNNPLYWIDPYGLYGQMGRHKGRQKPSPCSGGRVGVFGCLIGCASYIEGDSDTQTSLSPTLGGGFMACSKPKPDDSDPNNSDNDCPKDKNNNIYDPNGDNSLDFSPSGGFKGIGLGVTLNNDGSFCVLVGPFMSSPIPISENLGGARE